jgi:hypothetical protein
MDIPLTPDEAAVLEKMASLRERQARHWIFARWILPPLGLLFLVLSVINWHFAKSFHEQILAEFEEPPSSESLMENVKRHEITGMRIQFMNHLTMSMGGLTCFFGCLINACIGFYILTLSLTRWNGHREDRVVVKILRAVAGTSSRSIS